MKHNMNMKKNSIALFFLLASFAASSQTGEQIDGNYIVRKESLSIELTENGAAILATLPLKCITKEFPNKTNHISNTKEDHVLTPVELHPAFYGCFDWHSSVHGHWMLIKLLKQFPDLQSATNIRAILSNHFTERNMEEELKYFDLPLTNSWERTYGWAWLLQLDAELIDWDDADGKEWKKNLEPLTQKIITLWRDFLPKQSYANRTGVHPNTAFGLSLAYDYAVNSNQEVFRKEIVETAMRLFGKDKNAPATWEPNGSDFISPALQEAALMKRVMPKKDFLLWFNQFLSLDDIKHLTQLPIVSDRKDLQIVHLDGLHFNRSWCMKNIAAMLPDTDPKKKMLKTAAFTHLEKGMGHVISGEYGGEHWLASFAVYALLQE